MAEHATTLTGVVLSSSLSSVVTPGVIATATTSTETVSVAESTSITTATTTSYLFQLIY